MPGPAVVERAGAEHRGEGRCIDGDREAGTGALGEGDERRSRDDGREERVLVKEASQPRCGRHVHRKIVPVSPAVRARVTRPG